VAVGKRSSERALQKVLGKSANINEANPLEVHDPKVGSLISYEGTTTADGAGDGSSLIDSVLTTKPAYDGHWVVITSGPYFGQSNDITGATTGGTVTAHEAFDGQIVSGTKFVILAMKALPAEVAALTALVVALMADVGDPTGETLPSLATKWGDIARSLDLILGARWDAGGDLGTDIAALIADIASILEDTGTTLPATLATIAGYIDTEVAAIITSQGRQLFTMDFWSDTQEELLINATAGDKTLRNVAVAELPDGATIVRAIAMFKFRMVENVFDGANAINGAQHIQVRDSTPGTWRDAISIADNLFNFAEKAREGGDVLIGDHDIAIEVDEIATYNFQWTAAAADQISINFNDIQVGLRIWYSV